MDKCTEGPPILEKSVAFVDPAATERDNITQVESRADVTPLAPPNLTLRMYVGTLFTPHPIRTRPSSASIANWLRAAEGAVHRLIASAVLFHLMYYSRRGGQVQCNRAGIARDVSNATRMSRIGSE